MFSLPRCFLRRSRIVFLLSLIGTSLFGQQYDFLRYTIDNGLPQSQVNALYQDSDGFVWMGTNGGVARFDGRSFLNFDQSNGLPGNEVNAITEVNGAIIFATDSGIASYYGNKLSSARFPATLGISKTYLFTQGLHHETLLATDHGLVQYANGNFSAFRTNTAADGKTIRAVCTDSRGRLWLGTDHDGVVVLRWSGNQYVEDATSATEKLTGKKIRALVENENDEMWIGVSGEGLWSCSGTSLSAIQMPAGNQLAMINCGFRDPSGTLWFGTDGGALKYAKSVFKLYNKRNGLGGDVILSLAADGNGNVWLGTASAGASLYMGEQFVTFGTSDGLPDENIHAITCDSMGNVWIGTANGLVWYDGVDLRTSGAQLPTGNVGALAVEGTMLGHIIVGLNDGSMAILPSPMAITTEQAHFIHSNLTGGAEIHSLLYTANGTWIGTKQRGLFQLKNNQIDSVPGGSFFANMTIWSLDADASGSLWIGTDRGVFRFRDGKATPLKAKNRVSPPTKIYSLQHNRDYEYFVTASKGIWRYSFSNDSLQFIDRTEGLGSDQTLAMTWLSSGSMMVSTNAGIDRIDFGSNGDTYRHYRREDGLGTREYSPGAICTDANGQAWIGTRTGIIVYNASGAMYHTGAPRIVLRSVHLHGDTASWKNYADSLAPRTGLPINPQIPFVENHITFNFSGIQYGAGVNLRYQFMLEGYDKTWSAPTTNDNVTYSSLPAGHYRFLVRAGNSAQQWSEPAEFSFDVQPPFWATTKFFLVVLLLLLALVAILTLVFRRQRYEFVRDMQDERMISSSRMILMFAGILYPVTGVLIRLLVKDIDMQILNQVLLGVMLVLTAITSYFSSVLQRHLHTAMVIGYSLVVLHLLYLNYLNHLMPISVISLLVTIGAVSIVITRVRDLAIFSFVLLALSGWAAFSIRQGDYNPWLFLAGEISALLVAFVSVIVRHNLFNRLNFSDTVINKSRNLVIAANNEGKIIFASKSFYQALGYTEEEVLGDGWWKIRSENKEENERMRTQVLTSEQGHSYISPVRTKWGKTQWIQWVDTTLDNGVHVGVGQDVSDRHEIEERYRHIVESAIDGIYLCDFSGYFTYVNDVVTNTCGYSREEMLGKRFDELLLPAYVEEVKGFYEKQFSRRTLSTYYEVPILRKTGETIWIGQTVRAIFDDENPKYIKGFQAIARDITEKKRYEEELEKLSLVASETSNGVVICDGENRVEWTNEGFTRLTGYTLKELKGKRTGDVILGEKTDIDQVIEARKRMAVGESFNIEAMFYTKEGKEIWMRVSSTPIVDESGKLLKQIEIFSDITDRKDYEQQLSRYSVRLEILNNVKRDILQTQSVDAIAHIVLRNLAKRIPHCRRTSLSLFDHARGIADMHFAEVDGAARPFMQMKLSDFRSLPYLRRNEYLLVDDLEDSETLSVSDRENLAYGIRGYLVMPLNVQNELLGSINIGLGVKNGFSKEDIELVREVADSMAMAVQQRRYQELLVQKNKDISDSIQYARRIQEALLPPDELLRETFGDSFALYRPKDVLSGDFYWIESIGDVQYIAVADGTGHGVPGALISLMGYSLLNQALLERQLRRPAEILDFVSEGIQHALNQYKTAGEMRDGIDISLVSINRKEMTMQFSGAVNPFWLLRDGKIIEVKGDRFSLGTHFENGHHFGNFEAQLQTGDTIYLFSDGFADQFGGDNDKKFSYARFRETLLSCHTESLSLQRGRLATAFDEWKGATVQTDDVCVLGFRI